MNKKKCFYCDSKVVRKNGIRNSKQQFKCYSCGKQFIGGFRIDLIELWDSYTKGKQTYSQIASTYGCSIKTIQKNLDKHQIVADM
jgi:hypothetical protein